MTLRARIVGCGGYLPETIVTNEELAPRLDTTHDWIASRTGILQRHIAAPDQLTSDMGVEAARRALNRAGIDVSSVDGIIVATTTPDDTFPATAVTIQMKLGAFRAFAFDIQAVCSGFIYALAVADGFIRSGQAKTLLVIGAEVMSRILDWDDRKTCILFGDGGGAVVLRAEEDSAAGILSTHLYADGRYRDLLYVDGGPGRQSVGHLRMQGREVFKHAVEKVCQVIDTVLETHHLPSSAIQWFVPHQANLRILEAIGDRYGWGKDRIIATVDLHANTSAASIPLALAEAEGQISVGHYVLLAAIGGGFSWGSALVRW